MLKVFSLHPGVLRQLIIASDVKCVIVRTVRTDKRCFTLRPYAFAVKH